MAAYKRTQFWIDPGLQLQMLGFVLLLVTASLLVVSFSALRGLESASSQSRQIFHSMDWIRQNLLGPLLLSSTLSILATGLLTLIWSHRFAGPLRVLSAAMARLKEGNLSGAVRIRDTDTHQDLAREFAEMQAGLRALVEKDRARAEAARKHLAHGDSEKAQAELKALLGEFKL